jgi:hypothetical protein
MKDTDMTPTQEDREAAETLAAMICGCADARQRRGDVNQLLAYRLAAEERGARMALEAAAKAFEAEADTWVQTPLRGAMKRKGATAIRQIDPAALKGAE